MTRIWPNSYTEFKLQQIKFINVKMINSPLNAALMWRLKPNRLRSMKLRKRLGQDKFEEKESAASTQAINHKKARTQFSLARGHYK